MEFAEYTQSKYCCGVASGMDALQTAFRTIGIKEGDEVIVCAKCCMSVGSKVYSLTSIPYNPYNKNEIVSVVPYSGKSPTLIGPVVFQDNVWIGIDCIVSPGVALEENSFVKTMSIVNSSFEKNSYI